VRRYLTFSAALHAAAFGAVALYTKMTALPPVYSGFEFLGGQSGFGVGRMEPAPAPADPIPALPAKTDEPAIEAPKPSEDEERVAVPVPDKTAKNGKDGKTKGRDKEGERPPNKKAKGQAGGRGDSPLGRGDINGAKAGPVGGVGTSLEIGGVGPGGNGIAGKNFPYAWYAKTVQQRVAAAWDSRDAGTRECLMSFIINRDGSVKSVKTKRSSGDALVDLQARRAIESAAPFPPLPDGFKESTLPVLFRFRLQ
jgi:protein TonB